MKKILIITALVLVIVISNKENNIIIPESSIRFRVISNENKLEDLTIKSKISLDLNKYLYSLTNNSNTKEEALNKLNNNYDNINNYIDNYLKKNNYNKPYKLSIGKNYFPKKEYKGIPYNQGYYDSIVLTLGEGKGVNWWCVIYPPLCLINENVSDVEYTSLIKEIINKYKN